MTENRLPVDSLPPVAESPSIGRTFPFLSHCCAVYFVLAFFAADHCVHAPWP